MATNEMHCFSNLFDKVSLFHRALYITIVSFTPTHALVLSYNKIT